MAMKSRRMSGRLVIQMNVKEIVKDVIASDRKNSRSTIKNIYRVLLERYGPQQQDNRP